jgi:hypothetical protein
MRLNWKLVLVCLEIVLILTQDSCTVCAERIIGSAIILDTLDGTPTWLGSCGIPFRSVWMQDRCTVCTKRTLGSEIILEKPDDTPWWVTRLNWKLVLVHLEIVLILMQDRCTVCVERTIGSKIVLDTPNGTPRWHGSCGISFQSA